MKIAVIGSGISGLTSAYLLSQKHQVTIYEADDRLGGHTATKEVVYDDKTYHIDTGFIVFNDWTYPNFKKLLHKLDVPYQPTAMGFSVTNELSGLEYSGAGLDGLFVQRKNLFSVRHWRMITDILRFNKESIQDLAAGHLREGMLLGDYLRERSYSPGFIDDYLVPMGAAIWSASTKAMLAFPLEFFVRFFKNHGLLSVKNRPQWHVIKGGSKQYIEPLMASFESQVKLNTPVKSIKRDSTHVQIVTHSGEKSAYDQVVIAAHSDQALSLLDQASPEESRVLGAIKYQPNEVVLHTDEKHLPERRKAWSSWNYRIRQADQPESVLTYNMNILQGITAPVQFCVTLNDTARINPDKILGRYDYAHPVFSLEAIEAQKQWASINGVNRTWFCGAYWGNGFHEDGVNSALAVAEKFGVSL